MDGETSQARNIMGQKREDIIGIKTSPRISRTAPTAYDISRRLSKLRGWQPTRLVFTKPWPDNELPDSWFEHASVDLYNRVRSFAKEYFDLGTIPASDHPSPWRSGFSAEFIVMADKIAIPDPFGSGWHSLLLLTKERACLVTGLIARILEVGVFDQLLFGATKAQNRLLKAEDMATIADEGLYGLAHASRHQKLTSCGGYSHSQAINAPVYGLRQFAATSQQAPSRPPTSGQPSTSLPCRFSSYFVHYCI
jgi:hypothetical protein